MTYTVFLVDGDFDDLKNPKCEVVSLRGLAHDDVLDIMALAINKDNKLDVVIRAEEK